MDSRWGPNMRSLSLLAVAAILAVATSAQQANEKQPPTTSDQQQQNKQAAKPNVEKKPEPPAVKPGEAPPTAPEQKPGEEKKEEHYDMTDVAPVVTHHQITLAGKTLKYTATAGRLPIKRADGKIEAEMFFVSDAVDGQEVSRRPLTFAFNGGPGSASIWLHMGALGPRRVALTGDGFLPPAPYHMEDNSETLLDK